MLKDTISIDDAIKYLNSVMRSDPLAIRALMCIAIPCNEALADHPSAQVRNDWEEGYTVTLLGIINGLFGVDEDGWGAIAYRFDESKAFEFCSAAEFKPK